MEWVWGKDTVKSCSNKTFKSGDFTLRASISYAGCGLVVSKVCISFFVYENSFLDTREESKDLARSSLVVLFLRDCSFRRGGRLRARVELFAGVQGIPACHTRHRHCLLWLEQTKMAKDAMPTYHDGWRKERL